MSLLEYARSVLAALGGLKFGELVFSSPGRRRDRADRRLRTSLIVSALAMSLICISGLPAEGYEEDVHQLLTKYLAQWAGYSTAEAIEIAKADQDLDSNPAFSAMPELTGNCFRLFGYSECGAIALGTLNELLLNDWVVKWKNDPSYQRIMLAQRAYHFPDQKRLAELRRSAFSANKSLKVLGHYLHVLQDSFAHSIMDYSSLASLQEFDIDRLLASLGHLPDTKILGHLLYGHSIDKTWERPDLAELMARYVYRELVQFKGSTNQYAEVEATVARFIRETDKTRRLAYLTKLPGVADKKLAAGQAAAPSSPELTFRMKDGSTVSGLLQEGSLKLKSSVGLATVPVKDIVSFSEGQLRLKDGGVLKGELTVSSLAVASKYGTLQLNAKDILWFGVGTPPATVAGAPTPSPQGSAAKPPATGTQAPGPSAPPPTAKPSELPQAGALPSHYGVFLSSGGRLVELHQERAETDGVWWSVFPDAYWTGCCTNGPHPQAPNTSLRIVVFLKGLAGADPVLQEFVYVRRLHRLAVDELGEVARVMGPGSAPLRDEVVKGDAWAERTKPIPLQIGPIPGQQDMIVAEPANTITPGLYAFQVRSASAGSPLQYPRKGHLMFWVKFDPDDKTGKCTDWELVSWGTSGIKTSVYPCSGSPIGELSPTTRSATGDARSDRKTAALSPRPRTGTGQIIKVRFVNESSGPIRLQITGNGQIEVGGKPWATIQPGKSEEIPVMIGQQKLRVEKVRTAGSLLLWAGFRREKTVEIAPDKPVQITDDDFK